MIFVTVGTHEQPFDRLIKSVDALKGEGIIEDKVVMQTGFCTYTPLFCEYKNFMSYDEMMKNIENAKIVITHGGPSSFIPALNLGKAPIIVPRKKEFGEHVNDHQTDFCAKLAARYEGIIVIEDTEKLKDEILNYDEIVPSTKIISNNGNFVREFEKIVLGFGGCEK